jgi:hypothetical protein
MRSICKKGSATLVAVLALCAIAAASASASQFYVGGKALTGTAKLAKTVKVEEPIVLSSERGEFKLVITCKAASFREAELQAPGTVKLGELGLESCTETGLTNCSMKESIYTEPLEAAFATGTAPEDTGLFKQGSKRYWTILKFSGTCILSGEVAGIFGTLPVKITKGQTESTEQEFVGEGTAGKGLSMTGLGEPELPVYVKGKFKLKLESGSAWSYH